MLSTSVLLTRAKPNGGVCGVVSNHTISMGAIYNHNMPVTLGFNLAGNPYPSPVNWDVVGGWTKTNHG